MSEQEQAAGVRVSLLDECTNREAERQRQEWGAASGDGVSDVRRFVAPIVADVLELLNATAPVPPGPCWHDSGFAPFDSAYNHRCELLAGHAGAHQCERNNGTAVWPNEPTAAPDQSGQGAVRRFVHEWRTGWHQGAVNRAEASAARHIAMLTRLGEKPHRPSECFACAAPVPPADEVAL